MSCERYYALLSARMDRELTRDEAEELELHLVGCPRCRIVGEQMEEARAAFADLEDVPAPEGFAQSVMNRIQAAEPEKKIVPLFKRPQFRALAGLAACLVLVAGLYSAAQPTYNDLVSYRIEPNTHGEDFDANDSLQSRSAVSEEDAPLISAYDGAFDVEAPVGAPVEAPLTKSAEHLSNRAVLVLERMPEGGWELIPPETPVSPEGIFVTRELFEEIERMGQEQNITAERNSGVEEAEEFVIVVLEETK